MNSYILATKLAENKFENFSLIRKKFVVQAIKEYSRRWEVPIEHISTLASYRDGQLSIRDGSIPYEKIKPLIELNNSKFERSSVMVKVRALTLSKIGGKAYWEIEQSLDKDRLYEVSSQTAAAIDKQVLIKLSRHVNVRLNRRGWHLITT